MTLRPIHESGSTVLLQLYHLANPRSEDKQKKDFIFIQCILKPTLLQAGHLNTALPLALKSEMRGLWHWDSPKDILGMQEAVGPPAFPWLGFYRGIL